MEKYFGAWSIIWDILLGAHIFGTTRAYYLARTFPGRNNASGMNSEAGCAKSTAKL